MAFCLVSSFCSWVFQSYFFVSWLCVGCVRVMAHVGGACSGRPSPADRMALMAAQRDNGELPFLPSFPPRSNTTDAPGLSHCMTHPSTHHGI